VQPYWLKHPILSMRRKNTGLSNPLHVRVVGFMPKIIPRTKVNQNRL
jgi:hypothetical protein